MNNILNMNLVYNILHAMTLPPRPGYKANQQLFHAISPTPTNDGYILRYLPQHRTRAQAAITQLLDRNLIRPTMSEGTSRSVPVPTTPVPNSETTIPCQAGELTKLIELRFTKPFCLSPPAASQLLPIQEHPIILRPVTIPSDFKLQFWLQALQQLFQNMAWDRWRYRNGIPK